MSFFSLLVLFGLVATAFLIGWYMASQIIQRKRGRKKREEEKEEEKEKK